MKGMMGILLGVTLLLIIGLIGGSMVVDFAADIGRRVYTTCVIDGIRGASDLYPVVFVLGILAVVGLVLFGVARGARRRAGLALLVAAVVSLASVGPMPGGNVALAATGDCLLLVGGTMSGDINMGGNDITNAAALQAASGSESAPSYTFTGDLNSGSYRIGADIWANVAGGEETVRHSTIATNIQQETLYSPSMGPSNLVRGDVFDGYVEFVNDSNHNAFGDITVLPSGRLLIVYRIALAHAGNTDSEVVGIYSDDGGRTWSDPITIEPTGNTIVETGTALSVIDGDVYLTLIYSTGNRIRLRKSTDEGLTWGSQITVLAGDTSINSRGRVVQMADGNFILPYFDDTGTEANVYATFSDDQGQTWGDAVLIADGDSDNKDYNESMIIRLPDDSLMIFIREEKEKEILYATSEDNGATWSGLTKAFDGWGSPGAIALQNGSIVIAYRNDTDNKTDLRVSTDAATTWSDPWRLDKQSTQVQMVYAGITEVSPGLITVVDFMENAGADNADGRFRYVHVSAGVDPLGNVVANGLTVSKRAYFNDDIRLDDVQAAGAGNISMDGNTAVTTSAKTIVTVTGGFGALILVSGRDATTRFFDLVIASTMSDPDVVASHDVQGVPAARTYTRSGSSLQLEMASGTYNVTALRVLPAVPVAP